MILLVEKNDDFAQVYTAIFKSAGYTVTVVPTVAEALQRLRWLHPDIVVLGDWPTAGADGVAFCQRLCNGQYMVPIPVVMIGTSGPDSYRDAIYDVFVKKPFYVDDLLEAVGRLINKADARPGRGMAARCQFSMQLTIS